MFKSNPENTADIETLTAKLAEVSSGATISYADLSGAIGRNVQSHFWLLRKAIDTAERETGTLFEVVRNVGVKRLPSDEAPDVGLHCMRKIKRTAKRGVARLSAVRANDLSDTDRARMIAHKSQLGAISMVADGRKSPALIKEIGETGQTIPAGRVLEVLRS